MISSLVFLFFGFQLNPESLKEQHQELMHQNLESICSNYHSYSQKNFFNTTLSQNQAVCYFHEQKYLKAFANSLRSFYLNPFLSNKIFFHLKNKFSFKHSFSELFFIYVPFSFLAFLACFFLLLSFFKQSKIIFSSFSILFCIFFILKAFFFTSPRWLSLKDSSSFVTPFSSIPSYSVQKAQVLKEIDQKDSWLKLVNSKGQKAWMLKKELVLFWDLDEKNHLPNPKKQQ